MMPATVLLSFSPFVLYSQCGDCVHKSLLVRRLLDSSLSRCLSLVQKAESEWKKKEEAGGQKEKTRERHSSRLNNPRPGTT